MKYRAYAEYKDSEVEWLGEVPSDWEMWKLNHAFEMIGSGTTPPSGSDEWYGGDVPWVTTGELRENEIFSTTKKVTEETIRKFPTLRKYPQGSIVIAMYGATIGRLGVLAVEATTNQACCVMTKSKEIDNKYLYYWLQAFRQDIVNLASGGGQPNINQEVVASLKISASNNLSQQKITNFLDHETAKIDTLIEKQKQLIKLLKEKRQAVISHAVTKGLNPNASMRDSGVEWLGEVPEHWNYGRLIYMCERLVDGTHHSPESHFQGDYLYITAKNIKENGFDFSEITYLTEKDHRDIFSRCSVQKGDVLYIKDGATAGIAMVNYLDDEFSMLSSVALIRPMKSKVIPSFLAYHLNASQFKNNAINQLVGGAMTRFTLDMISRFILSLPPIDEQNKIVDFLNNKTVKFEKLIENANSAINLMQERRTALISAAVTGKIDVRNWEAPNKENKKAAL